MLNGLVDSAKKRRNVQGCGSALKDAYRTTINKEYIDHIQSPKEVDFDQNVFSDGDKTPPRQIKNKDNLFNQQNNDNSKRYETPHLEKYRLTSDLKSKKLNLP